VTWAALLSFFVSVLLGIPLLWVGGWPLAVVGGCSLLAGYAYTGGPYPLAYLGLGDVFVFLFFGWVAVGGVYYLNSGLLDLSAGLAGSQVGLLATVLIAVNNLRDQLTDQKAGKGTLVVRFGKKWGELEIINCCFLPFFLGIFWFFQGYKWAALLPWLVFPFSWNLVQKVRSTEPCARYNQFLAQGAFLHLIFGILLSLGLGLQ
jgi:1,4-dihydroxy-2-naphthoate octaprenyltransferase